MLNDKKLRELADIEDICKSVTAGGPPTENNLTREELLTLLNTIEALPVSLNAHVCVRNIQDGQRTNLTKIHHKIEKMLEKEEKTR